jgi:hypothetical protein
MASADVGGAGLQNHPRNTQHRRLLLVWTNGLKGRPATAKKLFGKRMINLRTYYRYYLHNAVIGK